MIVHEYLATSLAGLREKVCLGMSVASWMSMSLEDVFTFFHDCDAQVFVYVVDLRPVLVLHSGDASHLAIMPADPAHDILVWGLAAEFGLSTVEDAP